MVFPVILNQKYIYRKNKSNLNRSSVSNNFFANSNLTYIFSVCLNKNERQITMSFEDFKYIYIYIYIYTEKMYRAKLKAKQIFFINCVGRAVIG